MSARIVGRCGEDRDEFRPGWGESIIIVLVLAGTQHTLIFTIIDIVFITIVAVLLFLVSFCSISLLLPYYHIWTYNPRFYSFCSISILLLVFLFRVL